MKLRFMRFVLDLLILLNIIFNVVWCQNNIRLSVYKHSRVIRGRESCNYMGKTYYNKIKAGLESNNAKNN